MRRTLCIILLCLGCLVSSTIYAEEWILEKRMPCPFTNKMMSCYVQKPILTKDKKAIIFKYKHAFDDGEASYYNDIVDIKGQYYYSGYLRRCKPFTGAKNYITTKKELSRYSDEDVIIIPESERENRVKAAYKELGLPPFRKNTKYDWKWIYSSQRLNYFICANSYYKDFDKEIIYIFVKIGGPSKTVEGIKPSLKIVDLHNHRIKSGKYLPWKTVLKNTGEEAIYNVAKRIYQKALEAEKESTKGIQQK